MGKEADLVLEGGSLKALAHVGVVQEMQERGWKLHHIAGASGGAIVAALAAAGYEGDDWDDFVDRFEFERLMKGFRSPMDVIRSVGSWAWRGWANDGTYLRGFLEAALSAKGKTTFEKFQVPMDDSLKSRVPPEQQWSLLVIVADITHRKLLRLPKDFFQLGVDPDSQSVAEAVCASAAIPWVFRPVVLGEEAQAAECVDGGFLSLFPIDAFDRMDGEPPRWPTFGVKVWDERSETDTERRLPAAIRIGNGLVSSMLVGRDQSYLSQPWVRESTIFVDTSVAGFLPTGVSVEDRLLLVDNGREAAGKFLDEWNDEKFDRYKAKVLR